MQPAVPLKQADNRTEQMSVMLTVGGHDRALNLHAAMNNNTARVSCEARLAMQQKARKNTD